MSVNKFQPHVLVLPEDDANRELANGFLLDPSLRVRNIQLLPEVGGWTKVIERFTLDHVAQMDRIPERRLVLLIDLDGDKDRVTTAKAAIPERLSDRVFVLGVFTEPEDLRADLGTYEKIGLGIAADCREGTDTTWGHKLLRHNEGELARLRQKVLPILF